MSLKVGLKINTKKTMTMLDDQLAGKQIMSGYKTLERIEEYL